LETNPGDSSSQAPDRITLVTGTTGMVGGAIARMLLGRGERVRVMARTRGNVTDDLVTLGAELVSGEVTDAESVAAAVEGCSDIYHCAALVDPFHWNRDDYDRINVGGTRNLLEAARSYGVRRFLHMSSIAALGAEPGSHADETAVPYGPWKPGYGRSKFLSEELVRASTDAMHVVSVNPAVVFGPGDRHFVRLIEAFLKGRLPVIAFADRPLPLVYVDDVARGSLLALERGESGSRYILAQPTITVGEFFLDLAASSGRRPPRILLPDWMAIAGALGWSVVSLARRRRPPISSFAALRIGSADFDGSRATRELELEYTDFNGALSKTVRALEQAN
jgi:dihydroflavonol-4-reductase